MAENVGAESETYQTKYGRMDEKEYCKLNVSSDCTIIDPAFSLFFVEHD